MFSKQKGLSHKLLVIGAFSTAYGVSDNIFMNTPLLSEYAMYNSSILIASHILDIFVSVNPSFKNEAVITNGRIAGLRVKVPFDLENVKAQRFAKLAEFVSVHEGPYAVFGRMCGV